MEKKYVISKGMNLGQNRLMGSEDISVFEYQNTIQNIYEDEAILWEALRSTDYFKFINQSKEYNDWIETDEGENATRKQQALKILNVVPKEIQEQVDAYIQNKKSKNLKMLTKIEEIYKKSTSSKDVSPIEFDEDFAILDDRKVLLHNIPMPNSIDDIEGRKDLGFLASEWFGKLEDCREDCFCASFSKSKNIEPRENLIEKNKSSNLTFIFDAESKDLKPLLRLDLFQYCRNKEKNNLEKYTTEEIELLESLLKWSPAATAVAKKYPTWAAIPGGVGSNFVVGIIANNIEENSKEMQLAIQVAEKFGVPLIRPDLTAITQTSLTV